MTDQPFMRGDSVRLKSGGPRMLVEQVHWEWSNEQLPLVYAQALDTSKYDAMSDDELDAADEEELPKGDILSGYTCVWMNAAGERKRDRFDADLLVRWTG